MQIFYSLFGMNDFSWEFQLPCSISRKRPTSGSRQSIIGFIPNFLLLSEEAKRRQQKLLYNKLGFQIHFSLLVQHDLKRFFSSFAKKVMDLKRFNKPAWKKCKGIVSRDFAPYIQYRKNVFAKFFVFANIFAKNMCQQSCSRTQ